MSHAKQGVLENIRRYTTHREAHPDLEGFAAITYPDRVQQFEHIMKEVGGRVVLLQPGDDLAAIIRELYPEAQRFISDLELPGLGSLRPSEAGDPTAMNGTDVTIVETPLGVCENGCCWVEQRDEWRAEFFIAAMRRVRQLNPQSPFSGFISGPSKTADIEQALVMGAHGARGVTVLLR